MVRNVPESERGLQIHGNDSHKRCTFLLTGAGYKSLIVYNAMAYLLAEFLSYFMIANAPEQARICFF